MSDEETLVKVSIIPEDQVSSGIVNRLENTIGSIFPEQERGKEWDGTISFTDPGVEEELLAILNGVVDSSRISTDPRDRMLKSTGKSSLEIASLRNGEVPRIVDAVVSPDYDEVEPLLRVMRINGIKGIVSGGLTGVTGGFRRAGCRWLVSIDTSRMKRFVPGDGYAIAGPGLTGAELEGFASSIGYTIGNFPESFHNSTLGGWISTGASGQESNFYGDIEDMVLGATLFRSDGTIKDILSPRDSSGIKAKHLALMSEGRNGVIGDSIIRLRRPPARRLYSSSFFRDFSAGIRFLSVQDKFPAIARLSDPVETAYLLELSADPGAKKVLNAFLKVRGMKYPGSLMVMVDNGHRTWKRIKGAANTGARIARKWEENRYGRPEIGNWLWKKGLTPDTMETSCVWADAEDLYSKSVKTFNEGIEALGIHGLIMAHISHLYRAGPAIYFTFILSTPEPVAHLANIRDLLEKQFLSCGGSITHHHGIGTFFRQYVGKEKQAMAKLMEDPVLGDCE